MPWRDRHDADRRTVVTIQPARRRRAYRPQNDLLHAPVRAFRDVDLVLRRTGERVGAGELLEVASGPADHADDFSVEGELEHAARPRALAQKHHGILAWRNAQRVRRAHTLN